MDYKKKVLKASNMRETLFFLKKANRRHICNTFENIHPWDYLSESPGSIRFIINLDETEVSFNYGTLRINGHQKALTSWKLQSLIDRFYAIVKISS